MRLQTQTDRASTLKIVDELAVMANAEIQNAEETIPCVETDSRIGREPGMKYICDQAHLEWKLRQMNQTLRELEIYRGIIQLHWLGHDPFPRLNAGTRSRIMVW